MEDFKIGDATVLAVEKGQIIVGMDAATQEEDCGGCRSCAMKSLCRGNGRGRMELVVPTSADAAVRLGEKVRVAYREANPAMAALAMFAPPLLGLAGGFVVGGRLDGDAAFLAVCGIGLLAGLCVTFILSRTIAALRPETRLVPSDNPADA